MNSISASSILEALGALVNKKYVLLTPSCDKAIWVALQCAKDKGFTRVVIPDEGGWLSFQKYPPRLGFEVAVCPTNRGLLDESRLGQLLDSSAILLIHSMPGYDVLQPMQGIATLCAKKNAFLINDCCGSIGTDEAKIGDIAVCSFGTHKPINCLYGGMLATDNRQTYEFCRKHLDAFEAVDETRLAHELMRLQKKRRAWHDVRERLCARVRDAFGPRATALLAHPTGGGINLIVRAESDEDMQKLINIADAEHVEHTVCPRYIRTMAKAVCYEIKRIQD